MKIRILGSAAGGGFPQWNCNCVNCSGVRQPDTPLRARTQSSIAICGNNPREWILINASPDVLAQLRNCSELSPQHAPRHSPISAVILTDSQIDHVAGLLMLRESSASLRVWCNDETHEDLTTSFPLFHVLQRYCGIERQRFCSNTSFSIPGLEPLQFSVLPLEGKAPPYSTRERTLIGNSIALRITDTATGLSVLYAPALAKIDATIWQALNDSCCVLVDGTFWTDDEMSRHSISSRKATDMGHIPLSGPNGMLSWLAKMPQTTRKVLVHINNTNPILNKNSVESALVCARGVDVAYDGMEIEL